MATPESSRRGKSKQLDPELEKKFTSVIDGLKSIYREVKSIEEQTKFDQFYSPCLRDADFEAKPFVVLMGKRLSSAHG